MVWIMNETACAPEQLGSAVFRRRLLNANNVPDAKVEVDRISLGALGHCDLIVPKGALGWIAVLKGQVNVQQEQVRTELSDTYVALLPVGSKHALSSEKGAELLYAVVPDVAALDPQLKTRAHNLVGPFAGHRVTVARHPHQARAAHPRRRLYIAIVNRQRLIH